MRLAVAILGALTAGFAHAADLRQLDESNYERLVPQGKEVDAIYGDSVLTSDRIVAVVAAPRKSRNANLTVRNVGGGVIDLTRHDAPSDQLSCFYPGGGGHRYQKAIDWPNAWDSVEGSAKVAFEGKSIAADGDGSVTIRTGYELRDGEDFLRVVSSLQNTSDKPVDAPLRDGFRLDGEFEFASHSENNLWWAHDLHWRQAYAVAPLGAQTRLEALKPGSARQPRQLAYSTPTAEGEATTVAAGESVTWRRVLIPAADSLAAGAAAHRLRGDSLAAGRVSVSDGVGPVSGALITVQRGDQTVGYGLTDDQGRFTGEVLPGDYHVTVSAQGHEPATIEGRLEATPATIDAETPVRLSKPGYLEAAITDGDGNPIPAKVQLVGLKETPSPDFGPESGVRGVKNLQYTPDGRFRCKLLPGEYRWIASYGPEHDAAFGEVTVVAGQTATLAASLPRTVQTPGWLSSELHSHSSPSGDNTASQRGRVLNLLAEHLEFCPCTEHQRIDVYDAHLAHFDAVNRMLTCPGMELTGSPLPLNHQNAFPLAHKPHQQDGGGPRTSSNPVTQIERLAQWDDNAEKVIQSNHPDLAQMIGDRDENGVADEGFEAMFGHMDVLEIHPPELIFEPLGPAGDPNSGVGNGGWEGRGNAIVNWLQMLNLGYRVTGVVNTDAHYNFHGSGWLRNWVRSSTDDPAQASVPELVHEFEHGHVVMSNGPFMTVEARSAKSNRAAIPGDDLATNDRKASLHVVVRCPNWLEVNRVQLFVNGRPDPRHNYTARTHGDWFEEGPDIFDQAIELELDEDAHVVVACCGEGGSLSGMYGEGWGRNMPVAVANPIFIDTDGDADQDGIVFEPNGDDLGLPLPTPEGFRPSHGHDHPNHRHAGS